MENIDSLTHVNVEELAEQLARSFDIDKANVLHESLSGLQMSSRPFVASVHLSPVSTFIQGAKDGDFGYVVSSIAKHWGVLVGDSQKYLYHLVFEDPADCRSDSNPDSLTGRVRAVKFNSTNWDSSRNNPSSTKRVGVTRYSPFELLQIGMILICDC